MTRCFITVYYPLVLSSDILALSVYIVIYLFQCTVASKFLGLTESVRDAADLYLSLKYPPIVFINDTPCGFVRHMECRCLETSKQLWGDRCGCFEKPVVEMEPKSVSTNIG